MQLKSSERILKNDYSDKILKTDKNVVPLIMPGQLPQSSLNYQGALSARAISPISHSRTQSEIGIPENLIQSSIDQSQQKQLISQLGISHTSSALLMKSRKNKIFPETQNIIFKLPELSEYYYRIKEQKNQGSNQFSHCEENKISNTVSHSNSFFDFMNYTNKPQQTHLSQNIHQINDNKLKPNNSHDTNNEIQTGLSVTINPVNKEESKIKFKQHPENKNISRKPFVTCSIIFLIIILSALLFVQIFN